MNVVILILAAGASSRMRGGDKLLELVDGRPQLVRITQFAVETGAKVLVALPPDRPARSAATAGQAEALPVPDAREGMAASIRAGVARSGDAAGLMILPADMPELTTADLAAALSAFDAGRDLIWRCASATGKPGHPVIFPARDFPALAALQGDTGARMVLQAEAPRVTLIALPDQHALTDLDTPEDWAAWREKTRR